MLGIYSAEERQRHLETGSYEPIVEETGSAAELVEPASVEDTKASLVEESAQRSSRNQDVVEAEEIVEAAAKPAPAEAHTSAELLQQITGIAVDSPLCMTCGTKMRPAGSCYVCEGCGSTSGCS
jgi:ribonucleoside-diphosphate reductase alpha chain